MPKKYGSNVHDRLLEFNVKKGQMLQASPLHVEVSPRALIYCRVSSSKQVSDGHWLRNQEMSCRDWCARQDPPIEVDKVFIEPWISGSTVDRKEFNALLTYLKKKNKKDLFITHVIAYEHSRISRPDEPSEWLLLESKIKTLGAKVVSLDFPHLDDSTDEGILMKQLHYGLSGYERKKISRVMLNARKNRMRDWFRPFWKVPLWYQRKRISPREYHDVIDEIKWPIIKQGLEMYAKDILLSDADLWRFRNDKWLKSNAIGAKKLQRTFIEKTMQLHKIIFYSGHILYPDRWITTPIPWKHPWLISLETAYAIIEKQQRLCWNTYKRQSYSKKLSDEHPLRWVVTCGHCKRKFSSRNTSKYRDVDGVRIKKLYPYYGCNNRDCPDKSNVPKKKLEIDFFNLLDSLKLPEGKEKLIKVIIDGFVERKKQEVPTIQRTYRDQIANLKKRQHEIEEMIPKLSNFKLAKKLESERSEIDRELEKKEEEIHNQSNRNDRADTVLKKCCLLFKNPAELRKKGNPNLRKLLLVVRFSDNLIYTKNGWLQTGDKAIITDLFKDIWDGDFPSSEQGGQTPNSTFTQLDRIYSILQTKESVICAIWELLDHLWLLANIHDSFP